MEVEKRIEHLKNELTKAISSPLLTFEQTKKILECGIYMIYSNDNVIYIGKTNRNGKTRLRELGADYRSHTLNRKLLRELISETLKTDFPPLRKDTKHKLISGGILSEEQFIGLQKRVNEQVKNEFRFRFYATESDRVIELEHFAISVFNPKMND